MRRHDVLAEMAAATSPNEISTAIWNAREWLADHPHDDEIRDALHHLVRVERSLVAA